MIEGGVTRAPGTWYLGQTKGNQVARLVPFEFSEEDALVLEFTPNVMRVWRYGQLVDDGGSPYELATPFSADDLEALDWVQSADVIYLADGNHPIQKLSRLALDNWTISDLEPELGPFRAINTDEDVTILAAGADHVKGTSVTLTASSALFDADHVQSLFYLEVDDDTDVASWSPGEAVQHGDLRRHEGRVYRVWFEDGPQVDARGAGPTPPIHLRGIRLVEELVGYEYLSDHFGVVQITQVNSPTEAEGIIQRPLPVAIFDQPTFIWAEAAWSDKYGYPATLEIVQQRLVAAATPSDPRTIWFSTAGALEDFEPGTEADSAFAYDISGNNSVNRIVWVSRGRKALFVGAIGEIMSSRPTSAGQRLGLDTIVIEGDSELGCASTAPVAPNGNPIFITKGGRRIFEMSFALQADTNVSAALSRPARHLGKLGFRRLSVQLAPETLVWVLTDQGDPAVMLYDADEEVLGWCVLPFAGGQVLDLAVTPSIGGDEDDVLALVRRQVDGQTVYNLEQIASIFALNFGTVEKIDAMHLFAGASFDAPGGQQVFSVPHLVGEEVYAWTEFGTLGPFVVSASGDVDLGDEVEKARIGLFDDSHEVETLDIRVTSPDGRPEGRLRASRGRPGIAVHETAGGTVSVLSRRAGGPIDETGPKQLVEAASFGDAPQLYSGLVDLDLSSSPGHEVRWKFRPDGGAPMTVMMTVAPIQEAGP